MAWWYISVLVDWQEGDFAPKLCLFDGRSKTFVGDTVIVWHKDRKDNVAVVWYKRQQSWYGDIAIWSNKPIHWRGGLLEIMSLTLYSFDVKIKKYLLKSVLGVREMSVHMCGWGSVLLLLLLFFVYWCCCYRSSWVNSNIPFLSESLAISLTLSLPLSKC